MDFVNQIWGYVQPVWDWLYAGYAAHGADSWTQFGIQAGVIALVMALLMQSYSAILIFTIVGVIVHVVVDAALPVVREGAQFADVMPPFTAMLFWQYIAFLAAFYFVAVTLLGMIKALVFRGE